MIIQLIHEYPRQACAAFWLGYVVSLACIFDLATAYANKLHDPRRR